VLLVVFATGLGALVVVGIFGRLSANVATVIGAAIVLGIGGLGVYLLLKYPGTGWVDVGRSLVMGSVVSLAVGTGQYALEQKRKERESHQALRLMLSLSHDLRGVELTDQNLSGFFLADNDLSEARLSNSDLTEASLIAAKLVGADLSHAQLRNADLSNANLARANLEDADLRGAKLTEATLPLARMSRAKLQGAFLEGAHLEYACLAQARLDGAQLPGARLRGALLLGSHLEGAIFTTDQRTADLTGTGLLGAVQDKRTRRLVEIVDLRDRIAGRVPLREAAMDVPVPRGAGSAPVTAVNDGDNIELKGVGAVRLLGLNAPDASEPLGRTAARFLRRELPVGTNVRYAYDKVRQDKFHRKLLYVWLPDGRFLNEMLVGRGLASRLDVKRNTKHVSQIGAAEIRARAAARGIWRSCPKT